MHITTVFLFLAIPLSILFAPTSGQESPNTDTKGVAANTIDNKKNDPSNETGIANQQTAQKENPSAKQTVETSTKPAVTKPKPKPKPKNKPRRRRPRWRKRNRRPRRPRPTPKAKAKAKPNTAPTEKQPDGPKTKQSEPNIQTGTNSKETIHEKLNPKKKVKEEQTQVKDTKIINGIQTQDTTQTKPSKDNIVAQKDEMSSADVNAINEPQAQVQPEPIVKSKPKVSENKQISEIKVQNDNPIVAAPKNKPKQINEPKTVKKDGKNSKSNPKKKAKESRAGVGSKPKGEGAFADLEGFFEQFDVVTEATLVAPPKFDPNKKPGEKVLPIVDRDKGVAHDGTPCAVNYKEHPTDKTKYMMRLPDDVWQAADCPPNLSKGLIWRQDLCNCGEELIPQDPDDMCGLQGYNPYPTNRHKYMRRHHGINNVMDCPANLVWSQKVCLCLHDPDAIKPIEPTVTFVCKTILNLTFEDRLQNTAEGYYVKPVAFGRRSKIPRIRFVKTPGADGLAAQIVSQPLQFQAFRGNDFQKQVTFSLNFKISRRRRNSKNFMLLLTDECQRAQSGVNKQWEPSINLSFQPNSKTFKLLFRTEEKVIDEMITGAKPDNQGWYKVVVYFEDRTVNLENNGKKLFSVNGVKGKIPPNRCPLYIAGKGKGYDKKQNFYGYMDNIFLVKDCTFHESNIKIL